MEGLGGVRQGENRHGVLKKTFPPLAPGGKMAIFIFPPPKTGDRAGTLRGGKIFSSLFRGGRGWGGESSWCLGGFPRPLGCRNFYKIAFLGLISAVFDFGRPTKSQNGSVIIQNVLRGI